MDETTLSGQVSALVTRLRAGDDEARAQLLETARDRLYALTHRMLARFPRVRALEETDDVVQNAAMRVWKSLTDIQPANAREFFGLSTTQIRRELLDLSRRHFGRKGERDVPREVPPEPAGSRTHDPFRLAIWSEFHELAGSLPDDEREVVDLLWYQDLTQNEAARMLGTDVSTVKRRWRRARMRLSRILDGS